MKSLVHNSRKCWKFRKKNIILPRSRLGENHDRPGGYY